MFDRDTELTGANLTDITLDQDIFDNTYLTVVSQEGVVPLGNKKHARASKGNDGKRKSQDERISDYEAAARQSPARHRTATAGSRRGR